MWLLLATPVNATSAFHPNLMTGISFCVCVSSLNRPVGLPPLSRKESRKSPLRNTPDRELSIRLSVIVNATPRRHRPYPNVCSVYVRSRWVDSLPDRTGGFVYRPALERLIIVPHNNLILEIILIFV